VSLAQTDWTLMGLTSGSLKVALLSLHITNESAQGPECEHHVLSQCGGQQQLAYTQDADRESASSISTSDQPTL